MDLLETIRIFRRVVELESFSAAARELRTTQPSVSRAVAVLEETLGVQLVRRSTRSMRLTHEGQLLMQGSEEVLTRVDDLVAVVRGERSALTGPVRVAASPPMGRLVLSRLVARFRELHPAVDLQFRLGDGYVDLVEQGVDVAVRMGELGDSTLRATRIGTARLALYASKRYLRANGRPKTVSDLGAHALVFFTRRHRHPVWDLVEPSGEPRAFAFRPCFEADAVDMVREAVLQGLGISLLPTWMMIEPEAEGLVERLRGPQSREEVPIHALAAAARTPSRKQRAVIDFLREELSTIAAIAPSKGA